MPKRNRRERRALIALFIVVTGAVLAGAFGFLEQAQRHSGTYEAQTAEEDGDQKPYNGWRDSYAQWSMTALALAATGISILGVFWIRKTLAATRKGNAINREIGQAQVRAYLSCERASVRVTEQWVTVTLHLRNFGQSPAVECTASAVLVTSPNLYFIGQANDLITTHVENGAINIVPAGERGGNSK